MNNFENGLKYLSEGNIDKAEYYFSQAINENKQNENAWFYRGKVNRLKGDLIAALNDFHKTVDINPNNCEAKVSIEMINNIIAGEINFIFKTLLDSQKEQPFVTLHNKCFIAFIKMFIELPACIEITMRDVLSVKMDLCSWA